MTELLIGCRPVTWRPALLRAFPQLRLLLVYPDSREDVCADCGTPVYVGPRSWQVKKERPEAKLLCFVPCVAMYAVEDNAIVSLGNPHGDVIGHD